MAANDIILKVSLDGAEKEKNTLIKLQTEIDKLAAQKKALNQSEKDLAKAVKDGNITREQYNQQLKEVKAQQVENNAALKANKAAYRENERQLINNTKAQQLNKGSLVQLRAQLAKDTFEYDRLTKAGRENTKQGVALKKSIDSQVTSLKQLEKETGRTQRNVGNYGEAVNDILPIMGGFGGQIMAVQRSLGAIQGALAKVTTAQKANATATNATNKSLKGFRLALIATGIGAVVVALGSLVAAFLSTQRGIDAVTKVLRPLQEVFQSLIGVVQDLATKGFDRIKQAIKDPKQAFEDFGNFIKDQFITRVLAIPKAFFAINSLIINSIKLLGTEIKKAVADVPLIGRLVDKESIDKDLAEAKKAVFESAKELGDAQIEFALGVDAEKVREAGEKAGQFFAESAARGSEIDRLTKEIEIAQISLNRELSKGIRIFEEQRSIAEDTNRSTEERLQAAEKAQAQLQANVKLEGEQLERELKLAKLKTEANDTDREAKQEIQDIIAKQEEIEARALKKGLLLRNKANSIRQKEEAKRQKAIADEEKKQIESDKKVLDSKIKFLQLERQKEVATTEETAEEKFQKELEYLDKLGALRVEKAKQNGEDVKQVELENEIAKAELLKEEKKRQDEIAAEEKAVKDEEEKAQAEEKENQKKARIDAGIQAIDTLQQAAFDNQNRRIDEQLNRDIEALNLKREAGEISEEEFNQKRLELDKKAFSDRKRLSQAQNIIDFAVGVGKTLATYGATPAAIAPLALLAVQKGTQAAAIAAQKFAKGGLLKGASHENGGIPISVAGSGMVEAEGGEAIINKKSTAKHLGLLSAINQSEGGAPLARRGLRLPSVGSLQRFQNGGITPVAGGGIGTDFSGLETSIINGVAESIGEIKVTNVASETTGVANRVQQIQDSASF